MIYLSSDYHFFHDRPFIWQVRGFNSIEEMNTAILQNHNSIIKPEDEVYLLGDLLLGGNAKLEEGLALIAQLNGKLHLIRGNHCTDTRWAAYQKLPNVVEFENAIYLKYNKQHFYLSHYPTITSNHDYNKPLTQRLLNLCGHSHTKDKWQDADKGFIYHVEVDAHNNYPISIDTIIQDFKEKFIYTSED